MSLPSEEKADKVLEELLTTSSSPTSSSNCRDLIMDILNYATDYHRPLSSSSSDSTTADKDTGSNNDSESISLSAMIEKSNEASSFLINALNRFYSKLQSQQDDADEDQENEHEDVNMQDTDSDNIHNNARKLQTCQDTIQDTIIDIIWLVGLLLEPTKPYQPQQQQQSDQQPQQPSLLIYQIISSSQYKALCNFIEQLHTHDYLPTDKLAKRLEPSLLSSLNNVIMKTNKPVAVNSNSKSINSPVIKRSHQDVFFKKLRKINTDGYYRQKRYNLLPEESEGYAKLFQFLNGGLLMERSSTADTATTNTSASTTEIVNNNLQEFISIEEKMESVKLQITEYIGTFDLDPNRCLDITLDSLEYQIQSMIESSAYISSNNNNGSSKNSNGRKRTGVASSNHSTTTSSSSSSVSMFDLVRHSPEYAYCISLLLGIISMFPSDKVTHMIGFKYSSYKSSDNNSDDDETMNNNNENVNPANNGDVQKVSKTGSAKATATTSTVKNVPVNNHKTAPKSLLYTTAILASHGYVSLSTLIPHLSTSISSIMDQYKLWRDGYMTKIRKTGIVSLNSNSTSTNDASSKNGNKSSSQEESKGSASISESYGHDDLHTDTFCETNQFVQLLNVIVEIGLPWNIICSLFQTKPEQVVAAEIVAATSIYKPLQKNLCSYLSRLISPLQKAKVNQIGLNLVSTNNSDKNAVLARQSSSIKYSFGKHSLLPATQTHEYGLTESLSLLEFCDAISKPLDPIITSSAIASNPILYCNICRLFRVLIDEELATVNDHDQNKSLDNISVLLDIIQETSVFKTLKSFIIPSLSLFPYNPAISAELWNVLSVLPYQIRYAMYSLWRENGLEKAALRSIKRNELFSPKPLKLIESEVMTSIETKYILKRMSKDNIRDMGKKISKVTHNNPLVVFTLILNQIESYDNLILMMVDMFKFMGSLSLDVMGYCLLVRLGGEEKEIVKNKLKDDGVNVAQWLSSLETFAGAFYKMFTNVEMGGLLAYFTKRLNEGYCLELGVLRSLLKMAGGYGFADAESTASLSQVQLDGRCGSLLLKRETSDFGIVEIVNLNSSRRLRSSLQYDACGATYLILLSQLRSRILFDESKNTPKQIKLIGNLYDNCQRTLNILLAFLTDGSEDDGHSVGAIASYAEALPTIGELHNEFGLSVQSIWMLCRPLLRAATFIAQDTAKNKKNASKDEISSLPNYLQSYHPSSEAIQIECKQMLKASDWKHITPLVYQRFFTYHVSDIFCPEESYKTEISRLNKEVERLLNLQRGGREAAGMLASLSAKAAAAGGTHREIRQATAFTRDHERELERYKRNVSHLATDLDQQKKRCQSVQESLLQEKDKFFTGLEGNDGKLLTTSVFFANCIYPRILQSAEDAMYTAHFIKLLHNMDTPGFHTLQLLNDLVNAVVGALYSVTEDEAGCLSIFFEMIWNLISDWRYDKSKYESEVFKRHGSIWKQTSDEGDDDSRLSHDEYIHIYDKWHLNLGTAFIGCLQSKEYMHNRTGLILLTRLISHFPTKSMIGESILLALEPLQDENNPLQDIRTMAQGYSAQLIKARSDGVWKEESEEDTRKREEKEKQIQEEKRLQREKNIEEMDKEMVKDNEANQRHYDRDRRRTETRPPGHITPTGQPRMYDRGPNARDLDGRMQRDQRPMQQDIGPPPPPQGRYDQGRRDVSNDQARRRTDNRDGRDIRDGRDTRENRNQPGDNESTKGLHGRWEGNPGNATNDSSRMSKKRDRSPEPVRGKQGNRGNSMDRDNKRNRREPSPHRRHSNRRR